MSGDNKPKGIEEGKPIFIESLFTPVEYVDAHKLHPNTVKTWSGRAVSKFEPGHMRWRYKMGASLSPEEITHINKELDELIRTKVLLQ